MSPEAILKIAANYAAHRDSAISIRGNDDIVAFAQELLAANVELVEVPLWINVFALHSALRDPEKHTPYAYREMQAEDDVRVVLRIPAAKPAVEVVTDPLKIEAVFEHDQQCDDMAGVPVG